MAKRPDNVEKQIYSIGWLFYHTSVVFRRSKELLTTGTLPKDAVAPYILHIGFTIAFIMYFKNTNFDYNVLFGK